jgi:hypothetical protein
MRLLLQISSFLLPVATLCAQSPVMTTPPSGNNQKASAIQYIGPIKITVEYSSPAVHSPTGEDRRGKIWGKLVPFGLAPIGVGKNKDVPWRAGANENTTFSASEPVTIEGKPLAAGTYGLHMIPGADEWTIIFSRNASAWGSFFYDDNQDALRVQVKPHKHDYREWLAYDFPVRKPNEATAELQWEELAVPFTIKADVNASYITHLRHELTSGYGFDYRAYMTAAQFCLQADTDMEQGMRWAEAAVSMPGIGQSNFDTLSTKALFLAKLGKAADVKATMKAAIELPGTTAIQIHLYGRQLLAAHKNADAMEIFKLNAERNGDSWPVHVGLARGYSATGDIQKALEHARKGLTQAPDELNRNALEVMVKTLSAGNPINN